MTLVITASRVATIGYIALIWAFLVFVAGVALRRRWYHREHEDAAATEEVMDTLKAERSNDHIWDA